MGHQAHDFLMASGKLQILCYKEEVEALLRTKNFGGYQLLQVNDFPGEGFAPVGWLNSLWESKGYTTAKEFRRFNSPTVFLARMDKRVFSTADSLQAEIEIAHFGAQPIQQARLYWKLVDTTGHVHLTGGLPCQNIPLGNGTQLGRIEIPLQVLPAPQQYKLVVGLAETEFENDWEVWVYPAQIKARACEDVLIIHEWSELLEKASSGRKILFVPPVDRIAGDIGFGFSTIFWNTTLTGHKPPHTMGILCDPQHPLFREFPTDFHTNWQWWELIHHSAVMPLDCLPVGLQPLVQVIDDWFKNRRLGLIFEAKLQSASIIVCSIDLFLAGAGRLALRQFKQSLLSYMTSPAFSPKVQISQEHLQMLFRQDSGASASC